MKEKSSAADAGRSIKETIFSSWRNLLSVGKNSNGDASSSHVSNRNDKESSSSLHSSEEVVEAKDGESLLSDELSNNNNNSNSSCSVSTFPVTSSSTLTTIENVTEYHHNSKVFKSSNECVGYPLYDYQNNNNEIQNQLVAERIVKKKPNAIMMRRRRSPKRKSAMLMDTSDDENTSITNQTKRNIVDVISDSTTLGKEPVNKPNKPKIDEDVTMNDSNYFSDTEMYLKKKNVLEYSKPIPAHFKNRVSPFHKVFHKENALKPATPFPSPNQETPATRNDVDIPTAFHNLGLVEKLKQFCASIPSYSITSPVVYSPLEISSNPDILDTVYTCCGNNLFGQLGCGDKLKKSLAFQRRAKGPVKFIAGGNGFVLIATINNELYSCGDNSYGQCGIGPITKKHYPSFMKAVWDKKLEIKQVACGYHHSMILTTCGKVFSCGAGCAGALGLGDFSNRNTFQRVNIIFFGDEVDHIACGMHYSAIISKSGRLFVTGVNISGELGVGDYINRNLFTYVSEIPLQTNPQIDLISFRPGYSIIYTKYKQALIVGRTVGNRFIYVNGFPNNVKKIVFEGLRTIILCENGLLYKCNDDEVEFDSYQMPFFKFKQVNIPSRVINIHSGIGYAVAVTEDNRFFGIGDKTWIFAVLNGKDKTDENPMLDEFTKLRVDNFHNSVACAGTFTYYYTKSTKVSTNNSLIERIQPLDPFQDIVLRFETHKRVKTWSLSSVVSDIIINQKKKRKVGSDSSSDQDE